MVLMDCSNECHSSHNAGMLCPIPALTRGATSLRVLSVEPLSLPHEYWLPPQLRRSSKRYHLVIERDPNDNVTNAS